MIRTDKDNSRSRDEFNTDELSTEELKRRDDNSTLVCILLHNHPCTYNIWLIYSRLTIS